MPMQFITRKKTEPRVRVTVTDAETRKSKGFTVSGTTVEEYVAASKRLIESGSIDEVPTVASSRPRSKRSASTN